MFGLKIIRRWWYTHERVEEIDNVRSLRLMEPFVWTITLCCGCAMRYEIPGYEFYMGDENDTGDRTYAKIKFAIPERYHAITQKMLDDDESYKDDPLFLALME